MSDFHFAFNSSRTSPSPNERIDEEAGRPWLVSLDRVKQVAVALTAAAMTMPDLRRIGVTASTALHPSHFLEASESATDPKATFVRMRERVAEAFRKALSEDFREGTTSDFARDIRLLVDDFGGAVLVELRRFLAGGVLPAGLGFETLTSVAGVTSTGVAADRSSLIQWALASPSAEIRYGAAFALAALKDPGFQRILEDAVAREKNSDVRRALEKVLLTMRER